MSRKIIQICVTQTQRGNLEIVVALCDDGSLWRLPDGGEWTRIVAIPQPKPFSVAEEIARINALPDEPNQLINESDF